MENIQKEKLLIFRSSESAKNDPTLQVTKTHESESQCPQRVMNMKERRSAGRAHRREVLRSVRYASNQKYTIETTFI